jgi:hypothetical protein
MAQMMRLVEYYCLMVKRSRFDEESVGNRGKRQNMVFGVWIASIFGAINPILYSVFLFSAILLGLSWTLGVRWLI